MQKWLRQMALCFSAGSAGALGKTATIWLCAHVAALAVFAEHLANAQYPPGIYARIVWGGIAALLFLLPLARGGLLVRGLLWGVIVTVLQLVALPLWEHGGLHFSLIPALSAAFLNCVWGLATALALRLYGA